MTKCYMCKRGLKAGEIVREHYIPKFLFIYSKKGDLLDKLISSKGNIKISCSDCNFKKISLDRKLIKLFKNYLNKRKDITKTDIIFLNKVARKVYKPIHNFQSILPKEKKDRKLSIIRKIQDGKWYSTREISQSINHNWAPTFLELTLLCCDNKAEKMELKQVTYWRKR